MRGATLLLLGASFAAASGCQWISGIDTKSSTTTSSGAAGGGTGTGSAGTGGTGTGGKGAGGTGGMGGATCEGGAAPCTGDRADCDGCAANGCEVDLGADPQNCGRCGRSCGTQPCSSKMCAPELLSNDDFGMDVYSMTTDASRVYIGQDIYIKAVSKTGGPAPAALLCMGSNTTGTKAGGLAVQGSLVYWSGIFDATIYTCPTDVSTSTPTPLGKTPVPYLNAVAVDADAVFVASHHGVSGDIARLPLSGGTATSIDDLVGPHYSVRLDDTFVYFDFVDPTTGDANLYRVPKDGSAGAQALVPGSLDGRFALDATDLYFPGTSGVFRAPKTGGPAVPILLSIGQGDVLGIAVDDARVYWRRASQGDIWAWNKDGSGELLLATNQTYDVGSTAEGFTTDDGFVYWIAALGPKYHLYRTPK